MGEDGQDDHAGHAVADGDEPERGGADRLLGGQALGSRRGSPAATGLRGAGRSVGLETHVLGAVADEVGQRQCSHQDDDAQNQGNVLPADGATDTERMPGEGDADAAVDAEVDERDYNQRAAAAHEIGPAHGRRHAPGKPVVDGGHHGDPAAHALAQGHHHVGGVEHVQRGNRPESGVDLPEDQETEAQDDEPAEHHLPRAQLVGQVSLDGAHEAAFDAGQREGERQLAAGPAETVFEGNGPQGHRVEQRHRGYRHHEAGGEYDIPAVIYVGRPEAEAWSGGGCVVAGHGDQGSRRNATIAVAQRGTFYAFGEYPHKAYRVMRNIMHCRSGQLVHQVIVSSMGLPHRVDGDKLGDQRERSPNGTNNQPGQTAREVQREQRANQRN